MLLRPLAGVSAAMVGSPRVRAAPAAHRKGDSWNVTAEVCQ